MPEYGSTFTLDNNGNAQVRESFFMRLVYAWRVTDPEIIEFNLVELRDYAGEVRISKAELETEFIWESKVQKN